MRLSTPILVVDDIALMRELLLRHLRALGFTSVHAATSGDDAWRQLETLPVGLILSDWSMPGMSGLELLQRVRAHARLAALPFVLITAEMQRERIAEALAAGVSDFLLKPFTPGALEDKLRAVLTPRLPAGAAAPVGRATVLVVDDMADNLTLVAELLRDTYKVKLALRGDKALALAEAAPPDLVLLDIMMPDMDGFEVCRRLKEHPRTAHVPVMFLSALDQGERVVAGLALGAVDYVNKPIEPAVLQARVATALRLARAQSDAQAQLALMVDNVRLREAEARRVEPARAGALADLRAASARLLADPGLTPEQRAAAEAIAAATAALAPVLAPPEAP